MSRAQAQTRRKRRRAGASRRARACAEPRRTAAGGRGAASAERARIPTAQNPSEALRRAERASRRFGAHRRPLECQVLQEVSGTVIRSRLVARPSVNPDTHRRRLGKRCRLRRHAQAAGQSRHLRGRRAKDGGVRKGVRHRRREAREGGRRLHHGSSLRSQAAPSERERPLGGSSAHCNDKRPRLPALQSFALAPYLLPAVRRAKTLAPTGQDGLRVGVALKG